MEKATACQALDFLSLKAVLSFKDTGKKTYNRRSPSRFEVGSYCLWQGQRDLNSWPSRQSEQRPLPVVDEASRRCELHINSGAGIHFTKS